MHRSTPQCCIRPAGQPEAIGHKRYYLGIRDTVDQHPDRIFIALTPPPLTPASTTPENAARARLFADRLSSDEYLAGHPNLFTFDFFDPLAEGDPASSAANMLREAYRPDAEGNSHPNALVNATIGPQFVEFVVGSIKAYRAAH